MKRHYYLNKIHKLMDTEEIKIITGVRRSGKTHLLKEIIKKLQEKGIPKENIIYISLESNKHRKICKEEDLSKLIFQLTKNIENKIYLLLDEIHRVENWEEAINKFKINLNSDIYITSSNSKLLSDINTTPLSRYIQLKIHPFSYKEILQYHKENGETIDYKKEIEIYNEYLNFGGFPGLLKYEKDEKLDYLSDIYASIILKDIMSLNKIGSIDLFSRLMEFMISNIGKILSANSISKHLKSKHQKISPSTVVDYLKHSINAFIFYNVKREDLKNENMLKTFEKYYIADPGFYHIFNPENKRDTEYLLENIIFLELLQRNYEITIGKIKDFEVDFVCRKYGQKIYIQVAESIADLNTKKRELYPFEKIKDNFPKYIITTDTIDYSNNGIKHINILDFLKADDNDF